jgi:hypothetical protein
MHRPPARGRRGVRTWGADGFVGSTTVNVGPIGTAATRAQTAGVSLWWGQPAVRPLCTTVLSSAWQLRLRR